MSAPAGDVLQDFASGWLQGHYLYPLAGSATNQTLANRTIVSALFNGFQLTPMSALSSSSGSENFGWLQGTTNYLKAELSNDD